MDNWDCIKEVTGESETTYLVPEGQILSFIRGGVTYQAHSDHVGSVRMITDEEGDVVARYEYSGFGAAISVTEDPALTDFPARFIGSLGVRLDATTGLQYMRNRWYDSLPGRFISRDPVGLQGGANLYIYCGNGPLDFVDPFGLKKGTIRSDDPKLQAQLDQIRKSAYGDWLLNQLDHDVSVDWGLRTEMEPRASGQYSNGKILLDARIKGDYKLQSRYAPEGLPYLDVLLRLLIIHELQHGLNRPGSGGGSQSMEDESHGSTQEVPRRAA